MLPSSSSNLHHVLTEPWWSLPPPSCRRWCQTMEYQKCQLLEIMATLLFVEHIITIDNVKPESPVTWFVTLSDVLVLLLLLLCLRGMNNEAPWVKLKINIQLILRVVSRSFQKKTLYLKCIGKVHPSFCCSKDECAGVGHDQELDDGVVRFILLWLCLR